MHLPQSADPRSDTVAKEITLKVLDSIVEGREMRRVGCRLWDGSLWPDERPRDVTIVLTRPSSLKEMLLSATEAGVGEAYINGAFNIEGEMEGAFEMAERIIEHTEGWSKKLKVGSLLLRLPDYEHDHSTEAHLRGKAHSAKRDKEAIHFHYDVSNDFYRLWLDREMAYSCAYFEHPNDDLDAAQTGKFRHICRKVGIRPGMRVLDIGCGWGGLLLHAAREHGVSGVGITLSQNQQAFAQERIRAAGLEDRIEIRLQDYREIPLEETFDAIVSVGMVEHVGRKMLPEYFRQAFRLLRPGGLFLNHGIGLGPQPLPKGSGSFIQKYVFPDTDLIPIGDMLNYAEGAGWGVRDVESLREHYAQTLRHWVKRLEAAHDEALRHVNEATYRIWQLYMAGCAYGFQIGQLSIYQSLLTKLRPDGTSNAPSTRGSWYGNSICA